MRKIFERYAYNEHRNCLTAVIRFWINANASESEISYRYFILHECIARLLAYRWFKNILIMIPKDEKYRSIAYDNKDSFETLNNYYKKQKKEKRVSVRYATRFGLYSQGLLNRAIAIQADENGSSHIVVVSPENYEYLEAIPQLIEELKRGCLVAEIGINEVLDQVRQGFPTNSLTGWNFEALASNGLFGGLTNPYAKVNGYYGVGGEGACAIAGLAKEYGPCMVLVDPPAKARRQVFSKTTEAARVGTKVARAKMALAQSALPLPKPEEIFLDFR